MPKIPGVKKLTKFTKEFRGSFGRFKTDHSYRIYYLSTSVPVEEINGLSTASELFASECIEFEELIQRDIDHSRVKKIANDYLSKGEGRVVFFPPLLACIVLIDDDGGLKKQYTEVVHETLEDTDIGPTLRATWDHDGFQLNLPEADPDTSDRKISWEGAQHYFYDFASTLRLNPKRAKLVVLDGQHRLEALRLLQKNMDQQSIIAGLEIPICIIWAPEAVASEEADESMTHDFRELFVRVNSEPRKVSGHFIILLKDDSYSAMTMRRLADSWKSNDNPGPWSRLHLLEWNTREDERVDVRTRDFSITTVSIVAKVLDEHLFSQGAAPDLLNLEKSIEEFNIVDPEFSWDGLVDKTQNSKIDEIVKRHIDKFLVPALDTLFRKSLPYKKLENSVSEAFGRLQTKVLENNSSFIGLKSLLNSYIYREEEMFEDSARSAYVDFKNWIAIDPNDRIYFFSVFQQAMLRYWLNLSAILKPYSIEADASAQIAVFSLEKLVFAQRERFLSADRKYTRRTLWRNENVNFSSAWAKKAWADLIASSLLEKRVRQEIISKAIENYNVSVELKDELDNKLIERGHYYAGAYCSRLHVELTKETRQSFEDFFSEERAAQLRAIRDSDSKEFEIAVKKKADLRFNDAVAELADQLNIKTEELLRNANVD